MSSSADERAFDPAAFAESSREEVISLAPFTVRRVARWSECDPAGVVYTGNFTEYLLSGVHLFRRQLLGRDWAEVRRQVAIDTPAKSVAMVFNSSLWPDDAFETRLYVGALRNRTYDILADAVRAGSGESVFRGRLSAICVSAADRRIAAPIPEPLRERLERERLRNPAPATLTGLSP